MTILTAEQERILRAEKQALIHECEQLETQRTAHMRRLADIRKLLTGKQVVTNCNELNKENE